MVILLLFMGVNCAHQGPLDIVVPPPLSLGGGPPVSHSITPSSYTLTTSSATSSDTPQQQQTAVTKDLTINRTSRQSTPHEPITVINDDNCNQLWSQVSSLTEEVLESHPDTPYRKILETFRQLLEDVGAPLLIDAANTALGPRGQHSIVKQVEKLCKKFNQLGTRRNVLNKYPEYAALLENYNKNMAEWEGQCGKAADDRAFLCKACYLPAYLTDFILNAMMIEDETGYQLVNFQEPLSNIVNKITTEIKKKSKSKSSSHKKHPQHEAKGTMLERNEIEELEKFQAALKAGAGKHGKSGGSPITIIVVILIFVVILIAIVVLLRRKK